MNFDTSSAVAVDDKQGTINTTSFDINSAEDVPQLQKATPSAFTVKHTIDETGVGTDIKPYTDATLFLYNMFEHDINQVNRSLKDRLPKPVTNPDGSIEDVMHYAERVKPVMSSDDFKSLTQGSMAQLNKPINKALAVGAIADPMGTAAMVGGFMAKQQFFDIRKILDKYAPDTPTDIKDGAEVIDNLVTGGILAHGIHIAKPTLMAFLNERGLPDATTLSPDVLKGLNDFDAKGVGELSKEPQVTERPAPFVKTSQGGWPAQDIETPTGYTSGGVLEKLGINEEHFNASLATDMPVKVPLSKFLDIPDDGSWPEVKNILTFEGDSEVPNKAEEALPQEQGGETSQIGSGEETANLRTQSHRESDNNVNDGSDESSGKAQSLEQEELSKPKTESQQVVDQESSLKESIPSEEEKGKETRGLSKSVEEDAIHKGLVEDLGDLPSYKTRNMEEIAKKVSDFIKKDPELAKKIALGDAPEQDGLRSQELFTGLKSKALKEGDISLIHELGTSEKASAMATELGQRVKALDSGDSENPINIVREIKKSKEKPTKEMVNDKGKTAKIVKREFEKAKPKIDEWKSFIDEIRC